MALILAMSLKNIKIFQIISFWKKLCCAAWHQTLQNDYISLNVRAIALYTLSLNSLFQGQNVPYSLGVGSSSSGIIKIDQITVK